MIEKKIVNGNAIFSYPGMLCRFCLTHHGLYPIFPLTKKSMAVEKKDFPSLGGLSMKKGKSYKSLYLPAWTIVAAVLTLLLVIAVSTYRNMSRERGRMEDSLVREGLVIIRAIEASVRADFPLSPPDAKRLQRLVEEVSREPEVAAIAIFDHSGSHLWLSC
jgi:hypothetical protein